MSLPPELRVLCIQLSSTPTADLPRLTPFLLRQVLRCHVPLSSQAANAAAKADASASSVLVHKLKTQLTTLLNGKSPEGRFTAVVLIKAVVEVGGWEVLRGSEAWVRGLVAILGKPDSSATKELCILALTKIYSMTHQYQTLLREITTPTLPGFITACLNLISSQTSSKTSDAASSLVETIFQSFGLLLPRHTTIYRPFVSQIKLAARPYLAPTLTDEVNASLSLRESARRLVVLLHQTVAKGGGGEEWGKSFREVVKSIHGTADTVFRGVVEDWESSVGYNAEAIDINQKSSGGGRTSDDLPLWEGIEAGIERLIGLVELLAVYFEVETSTPVNIPLGIVADLIVRLLSIAIPLSDSNSKVGPRLNPAIDRDEKDTLWSGMPQIYVAALQLIETIANRLEAAFLPLAQGFLTQVAWVYTYGRHASEFREMAYGVIAKLLEQNGQSLDKPQTVKLFGIIRSCCKDLQESQGLNTGTPTTTTERSGNNLNGSNQNADSFLRKASDTFDSHNLMEPGLIKAAEGLLPLFFSHLPQQHLDIAIRSLVERTAILTHNKTAMLASVLSPFIGKNGAALPSIVPHLSRAFSSDAIVEILLRPRMPLVQSSSTRMIDDSYDSEASKDEDMDFNTDITHTEPQKVLASEPPVNPLTESEQPLQVPGHQSLSTTWSLAPETHNVSAGRANVDRQLPMPQTKASFPIPIDAQAANTSATPIHDTLMDDTHMDEALSESSDAESVHLTMQLDSDSDSE